MSLSKTLGYTEAETTFTHTISQLLPNSFTEKVEVPTECILTNTTSPVDQPETIRFAVTELSNVYNGTEVEQSTNIAGSKKGLSIVCQVKDIMKVTSDTDPTFRVDVPLEAHIVFRVPRSPYVTETDVRHIIDRAYASTLTMWGDGAESDLVLTRRLGELIRGAMAPSEL